MRVFETGRPYVAKEFKMRFGYFGVGELVDAYFNFVYHPLSDGVGRTTGLMAVVSDVTPQVLARREAEQLRAAAENANEAKSQLPRIVSHETRQPAHASLGYLDILTMELRAIVVALEPMVAPQYRAKGVTYEPSVGETPVIFQGEVDRTIQVCLNLLTNALKATPAGGRVTIHYDVDEVFLRIHVTDTGIGPARRSRSRCRWSDDHHRGVDGGGFAAQPLELVA